MNQLISNAPMQPNPNTVEHPLTLIEKLDEYHQSLYERWYDNHKHPYDEGAMDAAEKAINIVKQHEAESGWVRCAERLPKNPMFYLVDEEGEYFKARYLEIGGKLRQN